MNRFTECRIESAVKENEWVSSFIIRPAPHAFAQRKAGQYLLLRLPGEDGTLSDAHPFTMTGLTGDDFLKITVKKIGPFTTALHGLRPPAQVQVSGPLGTYGKNADQHKNMVFIAGGIGITPFISLLSHLSDTGSKAPVTLIWANNRMDEFFGLDFFQTTLRRLDLKIILAAGDFPQSPGPEWENFILKQGFLTRETLTPFVSAGPETAVYMCGSENMQAYVLSQLEPLGIPKEKVKIEKIGVYMKDHPGRPE